MTWDSEDYDTDSFHDSSTNPSRITIPSGITRIRLFANILFAGNASGNRYAYIKKNNANFYGCPSFTSNGVSSAAGAIGNHINIVSQVVSVTSGDYFEVRVYQDSGGSLNVLNTEFTSFGIEVIE